MSREAQDYEAAKMATTATQIALARKGYEALPFDTILAMRGICVRGFHRYL